MKKSLHKIKNKINYNNTLIFVFILSVLFLIYTVNMSNKNNVAPEAELRFSEVSKNNKISGSVLPASCESHHLVANGDGNYDGCATPVCGATHWNCDEGNLGAYQEYSDVYNWWCNGPIPGTNLLCQEWKYVAPTPTVNVWFTE